MPFPSPGDLPHPGIEPGSPALQTDSLPSEPPGRAPGITVYSQVGSRIPFSQGAYIFQWLGRQTNRQKQVIRTSQRKNIDRFGFFWFFLKLAPMDCCYCCLVAQLCPTLSQPRGLYPTRLLCPWDSSGKNPGVPCHFLLQGIFPTQGSNFHLLHWQADS